MSRPTSVDDIDQLLSPRDREDFSIFLRYPEIDFDSVSSTPSARSSTALVPQNKDVSKSSPLSNGTTVYNRGTSLATDSTVHDTPSRLSAQKENKEVGGWNEFIHLMQNSELPQECLQYLRSLGQSILNIGTILHSTLRPNQPSSVLQIGRWLLKGIKYSSKQVTSQIEAISNLKTMIAFNVKPGESQLWSTYRQRARMIAKNVSLPSKRELGLLKSLVLLYDAYVYNPFLQLYTVDHFDKQTFNMINDLYDTLMKWLQNYKEWCGAMAHLQSCYMQPLIQELSKSGSAKAELADFKSRITEAKSVLNRPITTGHDSEESELVNRLNLSARRPGAEMFRKRSKARYKREHTL